MVDDFDSRWWWRGFQEGARIAESLACGGASLASWRALRSFLGTTTLFYVLVILTFVFLPSALRTSIQHTHCRQTDRTSCLSSLLIGAPLGQTDTCIVNFSFPPASSYLDIYSSFSPITVEPVILLCLLTAPNFCQNLRCQCRHPE